MKKRNFQLLAVLFAAFVLVFSACKKEEDTVDNPFEPEPREYEVLSGSISNDITLDASKKYLLDGFVIVEDGATITIPSGTLIEANPGQGENASALIIRMGGKIMANGTASDPVIFTGNGDGYFHFLI